MISGLWSALATVVLGGIAFWQNKRYKELSDELNDRQDAPEFLFRHLQLQEKNGNQTWFFSNWDEIRWNTDRY